MEPTEATELSTLSDDELVARVRRDNDALALAVLQKRYKPLILKTAGGDRDFHELCDNLQSTLLGCVMDYRGPGVFSAFVKTALHNRAIDFGKDRKKRGRAPLRDSDGALSGHRKLVDDGHPTVDDVPADDKNPIVHDTPHSSPQPTVDDVPADDENPIVAATSRMTEERAKNDAFADFAAGISEGALREAARVARVAAHAERDKVPSENWPSSNAREVVVNESDEAKAERRVSGTEGIARVILKRPFYTGLLDLPGYDEDDTTAPREIERWLSEEDRPLDVQAGNHHESTAAAAVESAKRLIDKAAAKRVKDTVLRARDLENSSSRRRPGPANVRAFAVEAVLGPGKAPSPGALRARKCRARKKSRQRDGRPA